MTEKELQAAVAERAHLSLEQATALLTAVFELISQELATGEEVEVEGLGHFYTMKDPAHSEEDPPGSGHMVLSLPEVEPEFDAAPELEARVEQAMKEHLDLFVQSPFQTDSRETESKYPVLPDMPPPPKLPAEAPHIELVPPEQSAASEALSSSESVATPAGEVLTPLSTLESQASKAPEVSESPVSAATPQQVQSSAEVSSSEPESAQAATPDASSGLEVAPRLESQAVTQAEAVSSPKEKPLGRKSNIEFRDLENLKVEKEILGLLPEHLAKQYNAVPIELTEGMLTVAMIDPEDFDSLQVIRKETGLAVKPILTTKEGLQAVLDQYTGLQAELQEVIENADLVGVSKQDIAAASQEDLQDQTNENAPTARIVFSMLKRAVKEKASDVHIEPYENKVVVRFRVDGILQARVQLPKEIQSAIISRLKILANLKIDEQRLPQDGRFNLIVDHKQIDFRLSTIPVVFGEKVVMRILDKSVGIISLEEVGLSDRGLDILNRNMQRSHGMILVTGPTGSGKTTTLYAVLGKLMSEDVNILTLEDPVEYRIESINQSQVHTEIGYTFASGLRAVVRQDPDIVMLGEIRDQETADMAIHAALTGHVVLSTLHTNDAAGAFPRLIDMRIEPFLITSSVHTVIAQRLARKLCEDCKEKVEVSEEEMAEVKKQVEMMPEESKKLFTGQIEFFHGKGCDSCGGKGYRGRIGVFEVLDVSEPVRDLILKRSSGTSINEQAIKEGMVTMIQDGIIKAVRGQTSLEEVWRVSKE